MPEEKSLATRYKTLGVSTRKYSKTYAVSSFERILAGEKNSVLSNAADLQDVFSLAHM